MPLMGGKCACRGCDMAVFRSYLLISPNAHFHQPPSTGTEDCGSAVAIQRFVQSWNSYFLEYSEAKLNYPLLV